MTDHFPLMVPGSKTTSLPRDVSAPYDGTLLATVDTGDRGVVERALATAYALYRNRDAWLSPARRIDILRNVVRLMQDRAGSLALEAAREGGKPLMDSRVEVARAIDGVLNCAELLRSENGPRDPDEPQRGLHGQDCLHATGADRRGRGGQRVQSPAQPDCPPGRAGYCGWLSGDR
jgi:acyl-CoA reductase-like NAD-dependent aldehyde dehydrogenase